MNDFTITTDSNSDLPTSCISQYNLTIIPQYYAFGDTVYGDENNLTPKEFYTKMRIGELPKSMANNPAVIREKFEAQLKKGLDILHIAFSSSLSGSCSNVMMTANELTSKYPDSKIIIVDSMNVSLGEGLLVLRALRLKRNGCTIEEISSTLEAEKLQYHVQFTVDDLNHLQRGGRVSKATAVLGSIVNVKPILYVNTEGKLVSLSTVRGRKKSLSALVQNMADRLAENFDPNESVGIVHGDSGEDAQFIKDLLMSKLGCTNILINDVSPSIGTHAGPGTLGLCYRGKSR